MSQTLSAETRLEIVDWIVHARTGSYGDDRDPPPVEKLQGDMYAALLANAAAFRAHLMALDDDELLLEGQTELARRQQQEEHLRAGEAYWRAEELREAAERERARQAELGRRGGKHNKKAPAIVEVCQQIRALSNGSRISVEKAWTKVKRFAADRFRTSDRRYELRERDPDNVEQVEIATGRTRMAN